MHKKILSILVFVLLFALAMPVLAQPELGINSYANSLGLSATDEDPRVVIVNIVKYLMTFLGIIAVVVILLGGFQWMTAGGNEDRIGGAKKLIVGGVIGLIIILAAFAIVTFIVQTTTDLINTGTI